MMGYAGKILNVDLTKETVDTSVLKTEDAKKYIGGMGYAIKLLYDNLEPNVDPLSAENVLVLTTGPTSGLMAPTGWGYVFASKSPLSGGLGISIMQGFLGGEMKRAGYDAIIIKGKSEKSTYLWIDDDSVQFMNAGKLWGLSPTRVAEDVRKDLGDTYIRIAAIGSAGEKLVKFARITVEGAEIFNRTGLGAVMGSKNLKAIAIRGSKDAVVAYPNEFLKFCREYFIRTKGSGAVRHYVNLGTEEAVFVRDRVWSTIQEPTAKYRELGTAEDILSFNALGCLPARNFNSSTFAGAKRISGESVNEKYVEKINACSPCPISCEHIAVVNEGPYKDAVAKIDFHSLWAFGSNCGVDRLGAIIKAVNLCNHFGLDVASTGNVIGFAMDCYENDILTYMDTAVELQFGNYEAMLELIQKIGERKDLGETLAEGVKIASERIGKGAEKLSNHIKGLEMTGYDLRCMKTAALGFAVSFVGADHDRHWAHLFDLKGRVDRFNVEKGRGRLVKDIEDYYAVMDSLPICRYLASVYEGFEDTSRLYNIITGFSITPNELKMAGERINNLARLFNIREGFTREDDCLPFKMTSVPIAEGPSKGSIVTPEELSFLLDDYYDARGWNKNGIPTKKKLEELSINLIK
jgi:aldehyde:ferredoxin oxidoreductase